MMKQAPAATLQDARPDEASRRSAIYRVAGIAAALAAVLIPISVAFFIIWPPPYGGTAAEWFDLFQENALLGLMSLDLPFLVVGVLMIPVMLALYIALERVRPSHMAIGAVLYLVAVASYFGTNTSIEMLSLSHRYAEAATEAQRLSLLGAGEAMLATFDGTAFHIYYILGQAAGIIIGMVMLRSNLFSNKIAYLMIVGNAVGYLLYLPTVGLALSALAGVILWFWMILLVRRFLQLAREDG